MAVLPRSTSKQLEFVVTHLPVWAGDPDSVGLSPGEIDGLAQALDAATKARHEADAARLAAEAATLWAQNTARTLFERTARAIATIKAFAANSEMSGAPGSEAQVYADAQIDLPKKPSRTLSLLPTPTNLSLNLAPGGAVRVRWNAGGLVPTGTTYEIQRKITERADGAGGGSIQTDFATVGVAGSDRVFEDHSIPVGVIGVAYAIVARRGRRTSAMSTVAAARFGGGVTRSAGAGGTTRLSGTGGRAEATTRAA